MSDSKPIKIYLDMMSQPSRSVLWFCMLAQIPFEVKPIFIAKGEHKKEEYLRIHPFGKVPSMEDVEAGLCVQESGAIVSYLIRKYKVAGELYPSDEKIRTQVDRFMHWYPAGLRAPLISLFFPAFLAPARKIPVPEGTIERARKATSEALDFLEKNWMHESGFLLGNHVTMADLFCYSEISQLFPLKDFDVAEGRPRLRTWLEKMKTVPGYPEVHKVLNIVTQKFNPTSKL